jgi:hypothetical protein
MKRRRAILMSVVALLALAGAGVIVIVVRAAKGPELVFYRYVRSDLPRGSFADLVLTNAGGDFEIRDVSAAWAKLYPAYFHRSKAKHFWAPAPVSQSPAPTTALAPTWSVTPHFFTSAGGIVHVQIPMTPGAAPEQVGIEFFVRRQYQGKNIFFKNLFSMLDRLKRALGRKSDWQREKVWCREYLAMSPDGG